MSTQTDFLALLRAALGPYNINVLNAEYDEQRSWLLEIDDRRGAWKLKVHLDAVEAVRPFDALTAASVVSRMNISRPHQSEDTGGER